jgi:ATP-dependent Clp protease protease subunit
VERIHDDLDRDRFMSPEEAKDYGLIDNVITRRGDVVEVQHAEPETGINNVE